MKINSKLKSKQFLKATLLLTTIIIFTGCNTKNFNNLTHERTNRVFVIELDNQNLVTNRKEVDTLIERYQRLYNNKYCYVNKQSNEIELVDEWAEISKEVPYNDILLVKVVPKLNPLSLVYDVKRKLSLKFRMEGSNFLHIDASITKYKSSKNIETFKLTGGRFYPEDPDRLLHFYLSLYMKLGVRDFP